MATGELPYSDDLLDKVREVIAAYRREHGNDIDVRRLATGLFNSGVGLIDTSRRAFLVDLDVHTNTLLQARALEARIAELEGELARVAGLAKDLTQETIP